MFCFDVILILAGGVFVVMTMLRWFEQTAEAVDRGWWNKVALLVAFPFAVWFFPSQVTTGRPTMVPRHEPVRGFGVAPTIARDVKSGDGPPPGTPKEFIGMPVIPPKSRASRSAIDPEKLAKLKEKMRQQGMIDEE